ncbi:MAG: CRISPR-associated protein Cas4 [Bacteroidales bacterium]|nr:CRISPR-associated protein Cas4 [Bacteroidales bacterium]
MQITGTHFNYYLVCRRKLWLFANGINMEHTSDLVYEGKLLHESAYPQRAQKYTEVQIDGIKIDFFDAKNKIIHEIKKSDKVKTAHEWQLKYYIYILTKAGIEGVTGVLEYPKLRKTNEIIFSSKDCEEIENFLIDIKSIITNEHCPKRELLSICKKCSYYDFCYSGEETV